MGIEYYLVKPKEKEVYWLGKHIRYFNAIPFNQKAIKFPYKSYFDILVDLAFNGPANYTLREIRYIAQSIFDWGKGSKISMISDLCDDFDKIKDFKETGSIEDALDEFF